MTTAYRPAERRVQQRQFDRARAEFQRQVETIREGEERDAKVVLARHVPLRLWRDHYTDRFKSAVVDVLVHDAHDVELVIIKLRDMPHQVAAAKITAQLDTYVSANGNLAIAGGGDMAFDIPGANGVMRPVIRDPDQAVYPNRSTDALEVPPMPRLIVEIEVCNQGLRKAMERCREYFYIPQIRVVVLIKVFGRRADEQGAFACLAIVLRRPIGAAATQVTVADLVSFGSAALHPNVRASLGPDVQLLRELPLAPHDNTALNANPWLQDPHLRPCLEIAAADIFDGVLDRATNLQVVTAGWPALQIDLWRIYVVVNGVLPSL